MANNHYEILGVEPDASEEEIKKAARREAKRHHPDRPGGNLEKMQAVNRAKLVLLDPELRARYDQTGDDTGTTQLEQVASQMLVDFFSQYLEHGQDEDPLLVIRHTLKQGIATQKRAVSERNAQIAKLNKRAGRVKRKGAKKFNLFDGVLQSKITELQMAIGAAERQIAVNEHCALLIDDYEFNPPPSPPPPPSSPYSPDIENALRAFFSSSYKP